MRQSIARFLNESIRDAQQQDGSSMAGALRSSIAKQLRSSIALKQSVIGKKKENQGNVLADRQKKLAMNIGTTVFDMKKNEDDGIAVDDGSVAYMLALQQRRKSNAGSTTPKNKFVRKSDIMRNNIIVEACDDAEESDKSGYEEGENSMF